MGKLEGKVAIVTGAGQGIGRGITIALAREGAKVVVSSRTASRVESVRQEIIAAGGVAIGATCDVAHADQIRALVARTVTEFGAIDILVNNAQGFGTEAKPAGTPVLAALESFPEAEWDYTMKTGPLATLRAMQEVFPHMRDRGGRIINFGSRRGQVGYPGSVAYNAAKEAIRAITRTGAREWGRHQITVNVINPLVASGSVEAQKRDYPEIYAKTLESVPLGRFGDAVDDAGGLVVFLAGAEGAYLTGQTFMLDGGRYIAP